MWWSRSKWTAAQRLPAGIGSKESTPQHELCWSVAVKNATLMQKLQLC
jgi:hypothetical protein